MAKDYSMQSAFYLQLQQFYYSNKRNIRRSYKTITKQILDYNDPNENPTAFLRRPQFEAFEIYVLIKEFFNNKQIYTIFDDWRKHEGVFADSSMYRFREDNKIALFDKSTEEQTDVLFKQMKNLSEDYPNYIYALAMGLGKTILMATCIFYEFILSDKYPKDNRFCHNVIVFAPDRTVLESLREIVTFDKTKVIPREYVHIIDTNMKVHFLDDTNVTLNSIDKSSFNIIISNTQKIIVKKKRKEDDAATRLFKDMPKDLAEIVRLQGIADDNDITFNQRFQKLSRLEQIGIYVDEAHHLFGNELEKDLRKNAKETSLRSTLNILAKSLLEKKTAVVGCYNYTGTPYVKNQVLPEVVYAYGLKESIDNRFLKDVDVKAAENVKNDEFLEMAITEFVEKYYGKTYEGLKPKMAIFAAEVEEADKEVRPAVEKILAKLNIPISSILVNVGDEKITKNEDIRNFNDLDVVGSVGNDKQFLILVGKGREGWNCRSLFSVALFRSPKSKIFVLQATMRCLRKITDEQQTAIVFLSKSNYDILLDELDKNFNMKINDMKKTNDNKRLFQVRLVPPERTIELSMPINHYTLIEKTIPDKINFNLNDENVEKYSAKLYEKDGLTSDHSIKESIIDEFRYVRKYTFLTLIAEISRYLNISCIQISNILENCVDGKEKVLNYINRYNDILYDIVIPNIFESLFEIKKESTLEKKQVVLLREPKDKGYYTFSADPDLVIQEDDDSMSDYKSKSFHADTYCFDSKPEKELFLQYVESDKVKEIYFTGMFTAGQGDFHIQYFDPESQRLRAYYPDFMAKMEDGSYRIIEVKGDNKIDDEIVHQKAQATEEIASMSKMIYKMYRGSDIMTKRVLDNDNIEKIRYDLFKDK